MRHIQFRDRSAQAILMKIERLEQLQIQYPFKGLQIILPDINFLEHRIFLQLCHIYQQVFPHIQINQCWFIGQMTEYRQISLLSSSQIDNSVDFWSLTGDSADVLIVKSLFADVLLALDDVYNKGGFGRLVYGRYNSCDPVLFQNLFQVWPS